MHNELILILSKWFFNFDNWWELIDSLIAKIFASRGPLIAESLLKISLILSKFSKDMSSWYLLLGLLNLTAGIPDHDGQVYNLDEQETKVTPINKNKAVGMPSILDKDTKNYYLKKVGELVVKNKSLYMQLADAMYEEFGFDRTSGTFSDYIQEPKHVTYIQTWFDAYVND